MRILVVEDEASLREGISDLLRGDGHTEADPARPTLIVSIKGAGYAWQLAR